MAAAESLIVTINDRFGQVQASEKAHDQFVTVVAHTHQYDHQVKVKIEIKIKPAESVLYIKSQKKLNKKD